MDAKYGLSRMQYLNLERIVHIMPILPLHFFKDLSSSGIATPYSVLRLSDRLM